MTPATGTRVGVILGTDDMEVQYLGCGTYQGEYIPPKDIGGFNMGLPCPKLLLDNGDVVWGCECWWGPEKDIKDQLDGYLAKGYSIIPVRIGDARAGVEQELVSHNDNYKD